MKTSTEAKRLFKGSEEEELCNTEITQVMIAKKLQGSTDNKVGGADDLAPRVQEKVPEDWKEANVIPLYHGGSKSSVSNYIPVNLTSEICNLF